MTERRHHTTSRRQRERERHSARRRVSSAIDARRLIAARYPGPKQRASRTSVETTSRAPDEPSVAWRQRGV
jgi:hypothetical protein